MSRGEPEPEQEVTKCPLCGEEFPGGGGGLQAHLMCHTKLVEASLAKQKQKEKDKEKRDEMLKTKGPVLALWEEQKEHENGHLIGGAVHGEGNEHVVCVMCACVHCTCVRV